MFATVQQRSQRIAIRLVTKGIGMVLHGSIDALIVTKAAPQ